MRLTVWDASCVLRNYEVRTKQVITPEQLQDGSLAELLVDSDYNLEQSVSASPLLPTFSPPAVRKEEFRCVFTEFRLLPPISCRELIFLVNQGYSAHSIT